MIWQGHPLLLRPIRPEDEPQHRAFVESLEPQHLRLRFFNARRELPRSELARLAQIDYAREMAFIAVRQDAHGTSETLGEVRAVCDPDNIDAELAILVRSTMQGRGLGQLLLRKMIRYLSAHGTRRIVADVLRENDAMRHLARATGFTVDANASLATSQRLVLRLPVAAPS